MPGILCNARVHNDAEKRKFIIHCVHEYKIGFAAIQKAKVQMYNSMSGIHKFSWIFPC